MWIIWSHKVLPGLMADWLSGRLTGCLTDKIVLNFKILIVYWINIWVFVMFNKGTVLLLMYQCILINFSHKAYSKVDFGHAKILDAIFGSIPTIRYYRT